MLCMLLRFKMYSMKNELMFACYKNNEPHEGSKEVQVSWYSSAVNIIISLHKHNSRVTHSKFLNYIDFCDDLTYE